MEEPTSSFSFKRPSAEQRLYLVVALTALAVIFGFAFVIQNTRPVALTILFFDVRLPLIVLLAIFMALGAALVGVIVLFRRHHAAGKGLHAPASSLDQPG